MVDENETSLDFTPKVRLKEYKIGRVRIKIRIHQVPLPLLIVQCSLNSTNFLSKYKSYKWPSCSDPAVTAAAIIKWHQTEHNYAFRDLWNCWQTFQSRQLYKQLYRNWRTTLAHPNSWYYTTPGQIADLLSMEILILSRSRSIHQQIVAVPHFTCWMVSV